MTATTSYPTFRGGPLLDTPRRKQLRAQSRRERAERRAARAKPTDDWRDSEAAVLSTGNGPWRAASDIPVPRRLRPYIVRIKYNERRGYAYLRVNKSGSTSILTAVGRHLGEKKSRWLTYSIEHGLRQKPPLFVFTVVRHPLARLASCFADYSSSGVRSHGDSVLDRCKSFPDFVTAVCEKVKRRRARNAHYMRQVDLVAGRRCWLFDVVCQLERISEGWPALMSLFGLPSAEWLRKRRGRPWQSQFTPKLLDIAVEAYRDDFVAFDYPIPTVSELEDA